MRKAFTDDSPLPDEDARLEKLIDRIRNTEGENELKLFRPSAENTHSSQICRAALYRARLHRNRLSDSLGVDTPLLVGLSDNLSVNAMAGRAFYQYFILINTGLIFSFWNYFCALCGGDFYPYQFVRLEGSHSQLSDNQPQYGKLKLHNDGALLSSPRGSELSKTATWLWSVACDWIFFHEFAHFCNGHLDRDTEQVDLRIISEAYGSNFYENNIDMQTYEFDADRFATLQILSNLFDHPQSSEIASTLCHILGDNTGSISKVGTVFWPIISIFLILDDKWTFELIHHKDHPPSAIRLAAALARWPDVAKLHNLEETKYTTAILNLYNLSSILIGKYFQYMLPSLEDDHEITAELCIKYAADIEKNYAKLRPKLMLVKHCSSDLAPVD